jgi:hypothetical protein
VEDLFLTRVRWRGNVSRGERIWEGADPREGMRGEREGVGGGDLFGILNARIHSWRGEESRRVHDGNDGPLLSSFASIPGTNSLSYSASQEEEDEEDCRQDRDKGVRSTHCRVARRRSRLF